MELLDFYDNIPYYIEGEEKPALEYYPAENKKGDGCVIVCPGGGYCHRANHEGEGYAKFLNSLGIDAFVLQYRITPYRFPAALCDARRAVRYVRKNCEKFGISPQKIAIMGSSAGGHLAALTSVFADTLPGEENDTLLSVSARPNYQILCYPVTSIESHRGSYQNLLGDKIDELCESVNPIALADENTPPAFIWHTETDPVVTMQTSLIYAIKLHELNVRCDLHLYADGIHGLGLAENKPTVSKWTIELDAWFKFNNFYA